MTNPARIICSAVFSLLIIRGCMAVLRSLRTTNEDTPISAASRATISTTSQSGMKPPRPSNRKTAISSSLSASGSR